MASALHYKRNSTTRKEASRKWIDEHPEEVKKRKLAWEEEHPDYSRLAANKSNKKARENILDHYGRVCACCGELEVQFLELDHVNNDGA